MLSFFPTPYPDELWLSILWRYRIRNFDLLRPIKVDYAVSSCRGVFQIIKKLPEGIFTAEEFIMNNSLFPYYQRMKPPEDKKEALESLKFNPGMDSRRPCRSCRKLFYCPSCIKEDIEMYGESYWHREHQIPDIQICRKHKERLLEFKDTEPGSIDRPKLPEWIYDGKKDYRPVSIYEEKLSETLYQYLSLPFEKGPEEGYNYLFCRLEERYGVLKSITNRIQKERDEEIYKDLILMFGEELIKSLFGKHLTSYTLQCIKNWRIKTPEHYAALAVLLGLRPEEIFAEQNEKEKMPAYEEAS